MLGTEATDEGLVGSAGTATGKGLSDQALDRLAGWFAIVLRVGSGAEVAIAGPLAATRGVSGIWLAATIAVLCAWSAVFARWVRRRGLTSLIVLADTTVIVILISEQLHVVPASAIADGSSWTLPLASTAVFIPQLALRPLLSLAVAGVVTVSYGLSAPHPAGVSYLVVQGVVTAALMTLVRRGGRGADVVIARDLRIQQEIQAEDVRRADDREQHRKLHDTILSTLTMVASGTFTGPSASLSVQAADDLRVLRALPEIPGRGDLGSASLAERLRQVVARAAPLRVGLSVRETDLPAEIVEAFAGCIAEALRNVARHSEVDRAEILAWQDAGRHVVEISDLGKGFDPESVSSARRGIAESICGRMKAAGGTAAVTSQPGRGTDIVLRWPG